MTWYLAKLVYRIICGKGSHTPQFDEQLRLVSADSPAAAFEKARQIGKREEECFFNDRQQLVRWAFIDIAELQPLHGLCDGAELHSEVREVDDADAYIRFVHRKSECIGEQQTNHFYQMS